MVYLIGLLVLVLLVLIVIVATVAVRMRRFSRAVDALRERLARGTGALPAVHTRRR